MFVLRVHSVDTNHPLISEYTGFSPITTASSNQNSNTTKNNNIDNFSERRGIAHLYRNISQSSLPNPSSRSTLLFVVAVPNYFSPDDFIRFCGSHIDHVSQLLFLRNDAMEDRYSVLIELENQLTSDGFYCHFNGKRFSPPEAELCHILFLLNVEFTDSVEYASSPPAGFTELPTCPVCLERLDPDTSGILSTLCDHSFQCPCVSKWTHMSCQVCRFCQQQDEKPTCFVCETMENIWVCLICGFIGCGRYKEGHAVRHWKHTQHCYSLELRTQQIWDYVGDSYVHRLNHSKADGKSVEMHSRCSTIEGDCDTCGCSEDSVTNAALYNSKVEAIVDEYNGLLASELEKQRQFYESQLIEVKSKRDTSITETVEEVITSRMQEIQTKLENCLEEKKTVADTNQKLIKYQDSLRKKFKEIEERESTSLRLRDERIHDLEEQIRDLTVYIEAQKTLNKMTDADTIKGGTVLPVPIQQASSTKTRRNSKSSRRRK